MPSEAENAALVWDDPAALLAWVTGEVTSLDFAVAAVLVLAAGTMRGFAGFGGGMVLAPSLSLIYGPVAGVTIATALNVAVNVQLLPGALRATRWEEVFPMIVAAFVVAPFGVYILLIVDPEIMRRVIAATVLIFVAVMSWGWRYTGRPRLMVKIGVGGLSGGLTGAVGAGGAPVIAYLLSGPFSRAEVRGNIITVSTFNRLSVIAAFLVAGTLAGETLGRVLLMVLLFFSGAWLGTRLFGHANEAIYRRVAMTFLFAISLTALLK